MAVTNPEQQSSGSRVDGDELAASWHDMLGRYHRTTCALDRALSARHGLNVSEFEVLQQLHAGDANMRMHDLAEQVHLTQSALSRLISRIEEAGLVTRCVCTDDRRAIFIQLTDAGETRYAEAKPTHRSTLIELAAGDTPDCGAGA